MLRMILVLAFIGSLAGCVSPQFRITEADNRFSADKNPVFLSENNRISTKSIAGGVHIDASGVFLNPFVQKNRESGAPEIIGLHVINKTDYNTMGGAANQLGYITRVIFRLESGELISLDAKGQKNEVSDTIDYNSVGQYASYDKWETAKVALTRDEFSKLVSAPSLSCKIVGTKQDVVYEADEIAESFQANLRTFYNAYIR